MQNKNQKPNILFFFTDQQRWDTVGCYGNPMDLTPNLDWLAKKGVRFENAFTCQPVCGPARACIQTGIYATQNGVYKNHIILKNDDQNLAPIMNRAGYETAYLGKWHLAATREEPVPKELRAGYEYWVAADALEHTSHPYEGKLYDNNNQPVEFKSKYRVDEVTDLAIDYLDKRSKEKPFFLFLSYLEPHHQNDMNTYIAPEGYAEKYSNYEVPGDLEGTSNGDWKENLPQYYGICKRIDENLGRLLNKLEKMDQLENTIIIFTTDHGSHFRTRNEEYKRSCHEASIHIPMVISGPGFEGGKVIDKIVSLIDLPPTLVEMGGNQIPSRMQGRSLYSLVDGTATNWPEEAFVQISESQLGRAIRTKRWKYSVVAPGKRGLESKDSDIYVEEFLYDLNADPYERNNLVNVPELFSVRRELEEILKKRMVMAGEAIPVILPYVG